MAYPVDIPPTQTGYSAGINGTRGRFTFEYSGAFYAFLCRDSPDTPFGDYKVHALKSTDSGNTWAELDSASAPPVNPSSLGSLVSGVGDCYTIFRDGSTAWLLTVSVDGDGVIQGITATPFNLGAGTWGSSTDYSSPMPDYMANSGGFGTQLMISAAVCGTGNYQVLFSGASETISSHRYTRSWIASFDGSSWGSAVELPGQSGNTINYKPVSAFGDAAGRAHFVYRTEEQNPGVWLGSPIYHVALDTDGATFGTTQQITTSAYWGAPNPVIGACSELISADGQLAIAIELNNGPGFAVQSIRVFYATAALNPTWTESEVSTGEDGWDPTVPEIDFGFWQPAALTLEYANGSLVVAWCVADGYGAQAYWYSTSPFPSFDWATPVELFVPSIDGNVAVQIISFGGTAGVGLIGMGYDPSDDDDFLAQFFFVPIGATVAMVPNRVRLPRTIISIH